MKKGPNLRKITFFEADEAIQRKSRWHLKENHDVRSNTKKISIKDNAGIDSEPVEVMPSSAPSSLASPDVSVDCWASTLTFMVDGRVVPSPSDRMEIETSQVLSW